MLWSALLLPPTNTHVCCIIYSVVGNRGQLWNAGQLPPPPAKACHGLSPPTFCGWNRLHHHWQAELTDIHVLCFSLQLQQKAFSAFHLFSLLRSFRLSPGALLLSADCEINALFLQGRECVPGMMHVPQSVPVMCYICSLKSSTTTCSPTLTAFRWHSNMFCTWSESGLFTQPSHLLREKVPFQSRNTTSSLPLPSGKNKLCSGVNLLSLHVQAEVPTLLHLKTCLL